MIKLTDAQCQHWLLATNLWNQYVVESQRTIDKLAVKRHCWLLDKEKQFYLFSKYEESKIRNNKVKIAKKQYRGKGSYIEEILRWKNRWIWTWFMQSSSKTICWLSFLCKMQFPGIFTSIYEFIGCQKNGQRQFSVWIEYFGIYFCGNRRRVWWNRIWKSQIFRHWNILDWIYIYWYWCYTLEKTSKQVYRIIKPIELRDLYYPYHSLDCQAAIERILEAKGISSEDYISRGVEILRSLQARKIQNSSSQP